MNVYFQRCTDLYTSIVAAVAMVVGEGGGRGWWARVVGDGGGRAADRNQSAAA